MFYTMLRCCLRRCVGIPFETSACRPNTPNASKRYCKVAAPPRPKLSPRLDHEVLYKG